MKKLLLFAFLMMSVLPATAVDWQLLNTENKDLTVFIDKDSITQINDDEVLYALRYKSATKPERVVFLKSNAKTGYAGIVRVEDYEPENYRPNGVFATPNAFMKQPTNFVATAHNYVLNIPNEIAQNDKNIIPVAYQQSYVQEDLVCSDMKEYVATTAYFLEQNWNPPKSARNTEAIIIVTVGKDGSLLDYNFAKDSGNEINDRAVIAAVEKTVPYIKLPEDAPTPANLQFVFDYKYFKKYVR